MELRSRRAQYIYDRNYNRIGSTPSCTKQTSSGEVKTSVTQKEKSKGTVEPHYFEVPREMEKSSK